MERPAEDFLAENSLPQELFLLTKLEQKHPALAPRLTKTKVAEAQLHTKLSDHNMPDFNSRTTETFPTPENSDSSASETNVPSPTTRALQPGRGFSLLNWKGEKKSSKLGAQIPQICAVAQLWKRNFPWVLVKILYGEARSHLEDKCIAGAGASLGTQTPCKVLWNPADLLLDRVSEQLPHKPNLTQ